MQIQVTTKWGGQSWPRLRLTQLLTADRSIAIAASAFFFLSAQFFIPLLGIQADEALFATPILQPKSWEYAMSVRQSHIALMLMNYLGTLKTLVYKPLLRWFGTSAWSIREPMVIAGAASIWLLYLILRRTVGTRAAVVACCLLAGDTMYLLTTVFDWGPVALQHLLLAGGALCFVRFYQERLERDLSAAFLLFGLAMWDKALASWMLSGMAIAALVVFWRGIRKLVSVRRAAIAAAAFLLGTLPLFVYNAANHWMTFGGNLKPDAAEIGVKRDMLIQTVRGRALLGYFDDEARNAPEAPAPPISAAAADLTGHPVFNLVPYGLVLSVLLLPATGGRNLRAALFAWIALLIAWAEMLFTYHTGGSVHHTILLWPLPYVALAVPLAAASERIGRFGVPAVAAVTAVLVLSSVAVTNEYYFRIVRGGGSTAWSDASWTLAAKLKTSPAPVVYCTDWGILDSLRLIGRGRLPLRDATEHLSPPTPSPSDRESVRQMLLTPGALFVGHIADAELFRGNTGRLLRIASEVGLRPQDAGVVKDRIGRPTFQLYLFAGTR